MLDDPESQKAIGLSPLYQDLVQRLLGLPGQAGEPGVLGLNRTVTRLALEMEQSPREGRGERLEEIRRRIGRAVGLSPRERPASRAEATPDPLPDPPRIVEDR